MGEFQLRLTSQAARDLREIVAYIARDNPVAAERFGMALVEKAELLKKFPLLGKKVQLLTEDDLSKAGEPATVVNKLISRDGVVGILGEVASSRASLIGLPHSSQIP